MRMRDRVTARPIEPAAVRPLDAESSRSEQSHPLIVQQRQFGNQAVQRHLGERVVQRDGAPAPVANPQKVVTAKALERLAYARSAIAHTKNVLSFGAGNQISAILATNGNASFRTQAMRDERCWEFTSDAAQALARNHPDALVAARADLMHGGNDGEHASIAFDHLRVHAVGERIAVAQVDGFDHAFVLIGDPTESADDVVVADPWPTAATACTWRDHFAYTDAAKFIQRRTMTADGKNVKAVIAAGLKLTAWGKEQATKRLTEQETKKLVEDKDRNHLWQHDESARVKYDYVPRGPRPR